jgi:hypothetical protein
MYDSHKRIIKWAPHFYGMTSLDPFTGDITTETPQAGFFITSGYCLLI